MNKTANKRLKNKNFTPAIGSKTQFSKENQPPGKNKSDGWAKRRTLKELLEMPFKTNDVKVRESIAKLFDIPLEEVSKEITYEMIMDLRQMEKAILSGDTYSYKTLKEFVHGRAVTRLAGPGEGGEEPIKLVLVTGVDIEKI